MEALLDAIDLKQLGAIGVLLGYMLYHIQCQRKELEDEREYSREQDERFHAFALKSVEAMGRMEQAFHALKDVLR